MAEGDLCVVLSTCLAVHLGSPSRSVGPLSAQLQHVFAVSNTTDVSPVRPRSDKFWTSTL